MSEISGFLRCSCWAKFDCKIKFSTPSEREKICEIESLIRKQSKVLSTEESVLATYFMFISIVSETIWYVGFCKGYYFGSSWL